jgi:hypothetical protein
LFSCSSGSWSLSKKTEEAPKQWKLMRRRSSKAGTASRGKLPNSKTALSHLKFNNVVQKDACDAT